MTIEVWNPEHPHHAVWREYTQSLMDNKPKRVESRRDSGYPWMVELNPTWNIHLQCRIARPMLTLSYKVPMPVTEPLVRGQRYWLASLEDKAPREIRWDNDSTDEHWLRAGLIYLTEADAQAAIDAHLAAKTAALGGAK